MNTVHFDVDEAASLGHFEQLSDVLAIGRGYGVRMLFIYQDCGQLKKSWPEGKDQTLLANATQMYFGVRDFATAEHVSNMLGETTIVVDSGGSSGGNTRQHSERPGQGSFGNSSNWSSNWQQQARKLLKPEEVLALSPYKAIIFTPGVPPIWTNLVPYQSREFRPPSSWRQRWDAMRTLGISLLILFFSLMIARQVWIAAQHRRNEPVPAILREQPSIPEGQDVPAPSNVRDF